KGPYVSGVQSPQLWAALIADEGLVRSRLHELFLDLVIDPVDEFAFTRKIVTDEIEAPAAVRSERLTFLDTAMLLVLRQLLLAAPGEKRVIVDREEVYERLAIYRTGGESTFQRNLNGSWSRMSNRLRVLHKAGEDRFEISPMVQFLIAADPVRERLLAAAGEKRVTVDREEVYERLAIYRSGDESTCQRNLDGSWSRMSSRLRVLHKAGEDRFEISPMVKFLIDEDRVRELIDVYERIASSQSDAGEADTAADAGETGAETDAGEADAPEETTGEEEA